MHVRLLLSGFLLFAVVTDATAQNRIRWRPGAILEGLADTVQDVARDVGIREGSATASEVADQEINGDQVPRVAAPLPGDDRRGATGSPTLHQQPGGARKPDPKPSRAVSIDDVILMVHRGLGESTIVQFIGDNGVQQRLGVSDLIRLHEEGVSEPIILAMQSSNVVETAPQPIRVQRPKTSVGTRSDSPARSYTPSQMDIERFGLSILVSDADDANKAVESVDSNASID